MHENHRLSRTSLRNSEQSNLASRGRGVRTDGDAAESPSVRPSATRTRVLSFSPVGTSLAPPQHQQTHGESRWAAMSHMCDAGGGAENPPREHPARGSQVGPTCRCTTLQPHWVSSLDRVPAVVLSRSSLCQRQRAVPRASRVRDQWARRCLPCRALKSL